MLEQVEHVGDIVQPDERIRTINASLSVVDTSQEMQTREVGSLIQADDAIRVNTDGMELDAVVDRLEEVARSKLSRAAS